MPCGSRLQGSMAPNPLASKQPVLACKTWLRVSVRWSHLAKYRNTRSHAHTHRPAHALNDAGWT
eukprot:3179979-Amphidinium_carterae.1